MKTPSVQSFKELFIPLGCNKQKMFSPSQQSCCVLPRFPNWAPSLVQKSPIYSADYQVLVMGNYILFLQYGQRVSSFKGLILINSHFSLLCWTFLNVLFFFVINNLDKYTFARSINIISNFFHKHCYKIHPEISTIGPLIYRPTTTVLTRIPTDDCHWHMCIWLYSLQISASSVFILI